MTTEDVRADTRVCPYVTLSNAHRAERTGIDTSPAFLAKGYFGGVGRGELRAQMCPAPFSYQLVVPMIPNCCASGVSGNLPG